MRRSCSGEKFVLLRVLVDAAVNSVPDVSSANAAGASASGTRSVAAATLNAAKRVRYDVRLNFINILSFKIVVNYPMKSAYR